MIQQWIVGYAVSLLIKRLAKWEKGTDPALIKKDLAPYIRDLVPGDLLDDAAVEAANRLVDGFFVAVKETGTLENILLSLTRKNWNDAANGVKEVILTAFKPVSELDKQLYDAIAKYEPQFGNSQEKSVA